MIKILEMLKMKEKNKKAQTLSIIMIFVFVLGILIVGVLVMSLVNTVLEPFRTNIDTIDENAGETVGKIQNSFKGVWDWAIILLFLLNIIILFISSFMVDIHPAFLILYVIALMFLFMFGSTIVGALNSVYDTEGVFGTRNVTAGGNALSEMPLSSWILNHFTMVMLGIAILSGIIMYAKFKYGNQGGAPY